MLGVSIGEVELELEPGEECNSNPMSLISVGGTFFQTTGRLRKTLFKDFYTLGSQW